MHFFIPGQSGGRFIQINAIRLEHGKMWTCKKKITRVIDSAEINKFQRVEQIPLNPPLQKGGNRENDYLAGDYNIYDKRFLYKGLSQRRFLFYLLIKNHPRY